MSGIPAGAGSLLGKRLGKYEILALLALGGTAEIYLARIGGAAGFEKYVVVKCLHDHLADDQEFVKMFLDEARLAAHLDHSNIVQTMELGEHENRYYMVMEFLAGLSLAMVVRRAGERLPGGRVPVPLVLNLMAQACAGLHYAHERAINGKHLQIVHRDISPQNLVVSFEGVVKVVDFGIAKAEQRETNTRVGTIKGKFAYMSPEQCVATNVDRRTDVFALGVILWEMLTGKRLFKKNSPYETYQAVIECNVDLPSKHNHEIEPAVDAIVMKAMAKDKDDRYPTAEAFGDALAGYLHHRGKGSGPNEIGRFFDVSFAQEIEEHGARMRELIAGQDELAGGKWSEEDDKGHLTVDLGGKRQAQDEMSEHLSSSDLLAMDRPSVGGLTSALDDLDLNPGDEGDIPSESTRIEQNPHALINEMERASQQALPAGPRSGNTTAPPTVALQPQRSTGIPSLVRPSGAPVNATASATLSDQVIAPKLPPGVIVKAQTPPAGVRPVMPPSGPLTLPPPPSGPVSVDAPRVAATPAAGRPAVAAVGPKSATQFAQPEPPPAAPPRPSFPAANLPTMIAGQGPVGNGPIGAEHANTQMAGHVVPADHGGAEPPRTARPSGPTLPEGYPVMNPQMSEIIARGGDVYPSSPQGATQRPSDQFPQQPPRASEPGFSPPQDGGAYAANLMSPVGQHYPQQVDWEQAAQMPARALSTWALIALFGAAIVGALLLTLLIAKLAH